MHQAIGASVRPGRGPQARSCSARTVGGIVGTGAAMTAVFQLMDCGAASPISVLVEGEKGTGKELVARRIHRASRRAEGPFLAVNCAAVPEPLLESELFGHRRGAFTGATEDRRGLFEAASGGTLLLDEVGEMPLAMQAKLLRVLEERQILPVGATTPRKIDVRVIAATNVDLLDAVARRVFREDLYYRLSAFPIRLAALRERREEIPLLAARDLAVSSESHRKHLTGVDPEAMASLVRFHWPGNVRELVNEIERATALALDGETIGLTHLSEKITGGATHPVLSGPRPIPTARESLPPVNGGPGSAAKTQAEEPSTGTLREARAAFEARHIDSVLGQCKGNVSRTARALDLSRVMLQRKMKEYGLRGN